MNRFLASAAALVIFAACSKNDPQVVKTEQTPSEPGGSIVGTVTSLRTAQPLSGVTVTVASDHGIRSATTDGSGAYAVGGLLAGATYLVRFSAGGYVPGLGVARIPNSAGDFPASGIAQVNVALAEANSTLTGHVYAKDGAPAAGVVLAVDLRDQGFDFVGSATTDATGLYSLGGLPGAPDGLPVNVVVQPWDANKDGLADYDALTRSTSTYPGAASLLDVDLRLAAEDLILLTSNVDSGKLPVSSAIQLTFNRALDANLTLVTLNDSTSQRTVAVTTSLDTTAKILTIAPAGGTALAANHDYSLDVDAVAAVNGAKASVLRTFTAVLVPDPLPAVSGLVVNPQDADYNSTTFSLSWDMVPGAHGYQVWVRDTSRNPSYLLLAGILASPTPATSLVLPSTFDYYPGDGKQTPFAYGVGVDFAVVPVDATGYAPSPSSAGVATTHRSDTTPPSAYLPVQSGNPNNTSGTTASTVWLTVTFSEYMDTSVAPSIVLPAAITTTPTFEWGPNLTSGVFTITIPAGVDGRGMYGITGAKDTSGNTMKERAGTLSGVIELVTNGGFELGNLTGWTTSNTGTSTLPFVTSSVANTGSWSVQVGNATAALQYGYSTIYQTVTLPAAASSIVASATYRPYTNLALQNHDTNSCLIQDSTGTVTYLPIFTSWANSTTFTTATVNLTAYAGYTVRITCRTWQDSFHVTGMYLDDVSILATP